ncbi:type II toxin-antitoxin system RelB/DinJ family antitoxin [Limosilactobacillus sp.]|uniref:type II toxin-antitoxin system RelB/DinJ family antitoxin n=1 Tax=Limosilactobacillus sp. TaxID=2773925 RepID=UPI0035A0D87E
MSTSPTTIRLDDHLKNQLNKALKPMGLSINAYFNMAARQLVIQRKVPFEILTKKEVPTKTTQKALVEAEAKELGIIPDDSPEFDNVNDLKKYLDKE